MHFRTDAGKEKSEDEMSEVEKLRAQNKLLQAENRRKQMEIDLLKAGRDRKEAVLSQVRYETIYLAIRELHETKSYPICQLCDLIGIQRSSYYKWIKRKESMNEIFNKALLPMIKDAYEEKDGILDIAR
ncbi:hypothetical protein P7H25_21285 [Paenibacillus larvae]|nr:hypothetical protein [Paenibacillus larvae]MDT2257588.1 hypothetical protein [Paenibacillus larvae]